MTKLVKKGKAHRQVVWNKLEFNDLPRDLGKLYILFKKQLFLSGYFSKGFRNA